ncbi:hypothetical protein Patl1_03459 [Pistacia atlantica]|uniref:Uncharacterized protein n=1 Tax=Pistacia atlantica TaxID=434234 RepID=A0ACC1C9U9_9ROSI|nr:hypothetical protein Patl1_03459 [Pistacia atlantica]
MGWPLLGNMVTFIRSFKSSHPDNFICNLVDRYGRTGIYKAYLFGSPSVIVCTPESCRRVLMDDEKFGVGHPESIKQLTGKRLFHSISSAEHKRLRRLTTSPINGHEALAMYIGDSINLESLEKYYTDLVYRFMPPAFNIPGLPFHKGLKAREMLVKIFQRLLDDRRAMRGSDNETESKRGMIDLMMEVVDENGEKLEDEDIEEQEEIIRRRSSTLKGLNLKEIKQMEYLAKVINETLRRSTLSLAIFRQAKVDVAMEGYIIPKGWKVFVWKRGVHMDPET